MVVAHSAAAVRFCGGPIATNLSWGPPYCAGIHVVGVNLSTLAYRKTSHGVTWGSAYLAGIFHNGTLHVTRQGLPRPEGTWPRLADPPCSTPAGGWATSPLANPSTAAVTAYRKQFSSDITSLAVFRPRPNTWVVTLASMKPRRTLARLSSAYPGRLCVVQSRYPLSSVRAAAHAALTLLSPGSYGQLPYRVTGVARTVGTDGQPIVEVDVLAETTALRRALAAQPGGLVKIEPWLKPVSGRPNRRV